MENIICEPNETFDFSEISLAPPTSISGGAYFTKIMQNKRPLYIEAPRCSTKQGFIKNGKKMYVDLMFDNTSEEFINWVENLESRCQKLIYEKGESWFQNKLDMNDVETAFTSPLKIYKSGKFYIMRVNVKMNYTMNIPNIKIYNENETPVSVEDVVGNETNIISIVEIQGIRFTSRNFQIDMELKQVMVTNSDKIFEKCIIRSTNNNNMLKKNGEIAHSVESNINDSGDKMQDGSVDVDCNLSYDLDQVEIDSNSHNNLYKDLPERESNIVNEVLTTSAVTFFNNDIADEHAEKKEYPIGEISKLDTHELQKLNPPELHDNAIHSPSLDLSHVGSDIHCVQNPTFLPKENNYELEEFRVDSNLDSLETIQLKKPNEVYYEIYKTAKNKAKEAKKSAIIAYLEAKNIKKTYMLDDLDDEDDEDENDSDSDYDTDTFSETDFKENPTER